ncbi:MAG: hypothetical protein LBN92_02070 [Treponema sp.]|jgi:hypothetical protein|nr:hypothetical protein [Treponema sp.]
MKWIACTAFCALVPHLLGAQSASASEPVPASARTAAEKAPAQDTADTKARLPLEWSLLWSGAWESEKNISNRGELGLSRGSARFRLQYLERRTAASREAFAASFDAAPEKPPVTDLAAGLYHESSGTRLLYGKLQRFGLAARASNVWRRGAPYTEARTAASADLRTAVSSSAVPAWYAYLGAPFRLGDGKNLKVFASLELAAETDDAAVNHVTIRRSGNEPVAAAGAEYSRGTSTVRAEGVYASRTLPPREAAAWFSASPGLPERDTRLAGGSLSYSAPRFAVAADAVRSETFAFGRDWYGSLALRVGNKPWRFQASFDGAGSRYVDPDGSVPGAGFRSAFRLERSGKSASLFRLGALFRTSGPDDAPPNAAAALRYWGDAAFTTIDRHTLDASYRFPAKKRQSGPRPIRFSFSWARDRRDPEAVLDSCKASASVGLWAIQAESEGLLALTEGKPDEYRFSEELGYRRGIFKASAKAAYTAVLKKEAWQGAWNVSASTSFRWRGNRVTLKAAAADFPREWTAAVSWTLQK